MPHTAYRYFARSQMRAQIIVTLSVLVGGCGMAAKQVALDGLSSQQAACEKRYSPTTVPVTPYVRCVVSAERRFVEKNAPRDRDIHQLASAKRMVLAEHFDRGRISQAEYAAGMAEITVQMNAASSSRDQQQAAQQQAASAALLQSGAATIAASKGPAPPPPPALTRCTTYGNTTDCTRF